MSTRKKSSSELKIVYEEHLQLREKQNEEIERLSKIYQSTLEELGELKEIVKNKKKNYVALSDYEKIMTRKK